MKEIKLRTSQYGQYVIYPPKEMIKELGWKKNIELIINLENDKLVIVKKEVKE